MPDIGDHPRPGDTSRTPATWAEAFAALPDETPEPHGWQRLQERLAETGMPPRQGWLRWGAIAAAVAIVAAIPLALRHPAPAPANAAATTTTPSTRAVSSAVARTFSPTSPAAPRTRADAATPTVPVHSPRRQVAGASEPRAGIANPTPAGTRGGELESLYAQSARLESLLALARDDQVGNGLTTVLSDDISARIAMIDAALAQPGLDERQRDGLWRSRVEALRQLVGIEATDRLYSARGQSRDIALVTID